MVEFGNSNSIKALDGSSYEATPKERLSLTSLSFLYRSSMTETCHYLLVFITSQLTVTTKAFSTTGSSLENSATITVISFPIGPDVRKRSRVLVGLELKVKEKSYIFTHQITNLIAPCTVKTRDINGSSYHQNSLILSNL